MRYNRPFVICFLATFLFCIAAIFNLTPYLRGPAPYPPEWQWDYLFINTLHTIYLPILVSIVIIGLYIREENKNFYTLPAGRQAKKTPKLFLFIFFLMLLCFFFQLSILFFSRSGIPVLLHRIINPQLNGYFTASLTIQNVADFLKNYNDIMLQFVYHAKSHPPGAILLFYFLKLLVSPFTFFIDFANTITPSHSDVKLVWNTLLPVEKATALFSAFFIPFFSTVSLISLYFSAKMLYGARTALRSIFLLFFIPAIVFFIPINDAFLHVFSISAFFFLLYGLAKKNLFSLFASGAILFIGVLFNLSLLPVLLLFFIFALIYLLKKKADFNEFLKVGFSFTFGFFLPGILLNLFFQFNFIEILHTITTYSPSNVGRSYTLWLYFNLQDFLIFCGIPIALLFLVMFKETFIQIKNKQITKIDPLFIAFSSMILVLNFSGFVLGETGRIWLPYYPFIVLVTVGFMTKNLKFSSKLFACILLLQFLQILVMQEFWVMLW